LNINSGDVIIHGPMLRHIGFVSDVAKSHKEFGFVSDVAKSHKEFDRIAYKVFNGTPKAKKNSDKVLKA